MTTRIKLLKISEEIRQIITQKQCINELSFFEDTHKYTMKDVDGSLRDDYPSVTSVIKQFYNEFPALEKSLEMANGDIIIQNELLEKWAFESEYANNKGSRTHYILETDLLTMYDSYKPIRKPIFECDITQIRESDAMILAGNDFIRLMHRRGAVLLDTEMVLGSPELGYTGQPDKVWLMLDKSGNLGFIITDWKGLPLDTPILTNSGWKTMGTLSKEDKVYDKDGDLVNILNISEVKNKKCLKIKFDNGDEIVSDFEHRWLINSENNGVTSEIVMTTQEIKDYSETNSTELKIGNPKPLNNISTELTFDPYVLGVWLGDFQTNNESDILTEIKHRGYGIEIEDKLKVLELSNNNFLDNYLLSSQGQRLDLLRGVMDVIGGYNEITGNFFINTINESKINFFNKLISSFGIKIINKTNKYTQTYRIEFKTTIFNPFLIKKHVLTTSFNDDEVNFRVIKSVEEVESVPTKCIEVKSPTNTFLCGHNFLVTHNTNKIKNFQVHAYTKHMLPPFETHMDTSLTHYKIQLPLYARLLLKMLEGTKYETINFLGAIIVHLTEDKTFTEYRIDKDFIKIVMEMDPLIRIDTVKKNKVEKEEKEDKRKLLLKEELLKKQKRDYGIDQY
jgi:hypothetical protein